MMLGTDKSRGYFLEILCAEFLAKARMTILKFWLQPFRRLVVRYEKYAERFLGLLHLGRRIILLRHYEMRCKMFSLGGF
jgi:hypothetical protein